MSAVEGWAKYSIEECCEILDNKRIPINGEERELRAGSVPYYGANGLQGFIDGFIFDEDLILIAEDGGNFEEFATRPIAYQISGKSWVNNHAHVLRAKDTFNQTAIFYFLEHKNILPFIVGGTRAKLNQRELKSIEINFPKSEKEQTKIAEILSCIDTAIEQTEAMIAKQQRIKTGLMQDLLSKGIDEHGNIRSEHTHAFKDSPLGRIPEEWEVLPLGNVLLEIGQGWSPDCDSQVAGIGEWGVLKTTAVTWEGYQSVENKRLPDNLKPREKFEVQRGDVLMTRAGPNSRVGVVSFVYQTDEYRMLSDKLYRLKTDSSLDARFLVYSLSGFQSQKHLSTLKTGMAESQTNISQEIVKKMLILLPDEIEQICIADTLDRFCRESNEGNDTLDKLRKLKTALMQDLLSGKVRVNPLLQPN